MKATYSLNSPTLFSQEDDPDPTHQNTLAKEAERSAEPTILYNTQPAQAPHFAQVPQTVIQPSSIPFARRKSTLNDVHILNRLVIRRGTLCSVALIPLGTLAFNILMISLRLGK